MKLTNDFIGDLVATIKNASVEILKIYQTDFRVFLKDDNSPVTLADKKSSEVITSFLKQTEIPVISEEEAIIDFEQRQHEPYIWLVDPLDGTKEFIRKNNEFCINIALVRNGEPYFGLIADPVQQQILFGGEDQKPLLVPFAAVDVMSEKYLLRRKTGQKKKGLIFSRSHFSPEINELLQKIEDRYGTLQLLKKGSALKFFDLVSGRADFYPRIGPTMEWDIAAGHAIYRSVGGEVFNLSTFEPLRYNKKSLVNPGFIAKPVTLNIH